MSQSIIKTVIATAESVDLFLEKTGIEKKQLVLENVKEQLGVEVYARYYYVISELIDFVVDISKNGLTTTINQSVDVLKTDCFKVFSCLK